MAMAYKKSKFKWKKLKPGYVYALVYGIAMGCYKTKEGVYFWEVSDGLGVIAQGEVVSMRSAKNACSLALTCHANRILDMAKEAKDKG